MDRETITKAALDYVEQHYPSNHPFKEHDVNVFMQGVRWCINSVWHTDLKEAQTQKQFIVEFTNGRIGLFDDIRCLKGIEDLVLRYAYVDDLLPDRKLTESAENFPQNSADFPRKFRECRKTSSGGKEAEL